MGNPLETKSEKFKRFLKKIGKENDGKYKNTPPWKLDETLFKLHGVKSADVRRALKQKSPP